MLNFVFLGLLVFWFIKNYNIKLLCLGVIIMFLSDDNEELFFLRESI